MTTILKSSNAYGGASTLTNVAVITKTAADIYAEYAARVVADGGSVSDATECQAAIQSALNGDYFYRIAAAVCPRWGYKVSGANITKLYSIRGTIDAIMSGTVALDTTTVVGERLAEFSAGTDIMTLTGLTVLASGADGLAVLACTQGLAGALGRTSFTPVAQAWDVDLGATNLQTRVNAVQKYASNPEYSGSSLEAQTIITEMSTQRCTGLTDGLVKKVMTPSGGFTSLVAGATANVTYTTVGGIPRFAEWWFFNDVSGINGINAMMRATEDVGARY